MGLIVVAVLRRSNEENPCPITQISAAGLSQDVLLSSNPPQQQALQTLQSSLSSGDLNGAQSAFSDAADAVPEFRTYHWQHLGKQFSTRH